MNSNEKVCTALKPLDVEFSFLHIQMLIILIVSYYNNDDKTTAVIIEHHPKSRYINLSLIL